MVHRGENARLALETRDSLGITGDFLGQGLDGNLTFELRVSREVDLPRYTQIVFESQRNTNFVFNRSKKGSAPCGKVEKEDDVAFGRRQSLQLRLS